MTARRLVPAALASLCALVGALALWPAPAGAADRHNYLFQFSEVPSVGPHGETIAEPGPLNRVRSMTVDEGEVYVADGSYQRNRLDKFSAATGAFLGQFPLPSPPLEFEEVGIAVGHAGGEKTVYVGANEVVGGPHAVVTVHDAAGDLKTVWHGSHTLSGGFGVFEGSNGDVAVDNSTGVPGDWAENDVYVADPQHRVVDVFEPESGSGEGTPVAELTGPSPSEPFTKPTQVTVSPTSGEVAVEDENTIDLFRPGALPGEYEFIGEAAFPSEFLNLHLTFMDASDGAGDIYVSGYMAGEKQYVLEFDATGEYEGQITPTAAPGESWGGGGHPAGVTADPETGKVYVSTEGGGEKEAEPIFAFGPNIVLPDVFTEAASAVGPTSATLNGAVNLDKAGTATCRFVWGTSAEELTNHAPCTASVQAEGRVSVGASLTGLQPDTTYYDRLEATNAHGTNGESQLLQFTTPGPGLRSESVADVAATSATVEATLNPDGRPTSYYFQYGRSATYEFAQPEAPGTGLGAASEEIGVNEHLQGLAPGAVYHYRVVAVSELEVRPGVVEAVAFTGVDHTFTTQPPGSSLALLDGRGWEMVSPVEKRGGLISGLTTGVLAQAAANGEAMTFDATNTPAGEAQGNTNEVQILATRGQSGWSSQDIAPSHADAIGIHSSPDEYSGFSEDLTLALVFPYEHSYASFAPFVWPADTEHTPYIRHNASCVTTPATCLEPLVTEAPGYADEPPGTSAFGENSTIDGATPDLAHVVLSDPGGPLYEWSATGPRSDALQPISVLPLTEGGTLVSGSLEPAQASRHALSADGSRIVWSTRSGDADSGLYLRDVDSGETLRLDSVQQSGSGSGPVNPIFQGASSDDSRVFFTDTRQLTAGSGANEKEPDLYECEVVETGGEPACKLTDLTPATTSGSADVLGTVAGLSQDGESVYFVANGLLTTTESSTGETARTGNCLPSNTYLEGTGRVCNLYVRRYDSAAASWEAPRLVAVLSGQDNYDWTIYMAEQPTEVSPDGRYFTFMSSRSLTGYDNRDAVSGRPDEEVYIYDAGEDHLSCASCDPTGGRPTGYEVGSSAEEAGSGLGLASGRLVEKTSWTSGGYWIAAQTPGWDGPLVRQPRFLSNEGRLFFDSGDALAPQDIDGTQDAYEYEPPGVGSCSPGSSTYSERATGCIGLISSGASPQESAFLEASESGSDVFFLTTEPLVRDDIDTAYDVYDAHVCTGSAPCISAAASSPPCMTADSCRAAPAPQPPIFGSPASATFSGAGNTAPSSGAPAAKPRGLTRAQELARALSACHRERKAGRAACEQRARRRYGSDSARRSRARHDRARHARKGHSRKAGAR